MISRLKGHRLEQLRLLAADGAQSRESAVAASFNHAYNPGTLSAMIGEGLVDNAHLAFKGDSKRRVSHYWLTDGGRAALASAQSGASSGDRR